MTTWNPAQYLLFGNERLRPALDLMARIPLESPATVYDLGCGPGNVTAILKDRWPKAAVTGIDSSPEMLERARALRKDISWQAADLNTWLPEAPAAVFYSNAALHWLKGHERLFPHLVEGIMPGGILAVQMPQNFAAASHTSIVEVARAAPWRERLEPHLLISPTHPAAAYYSILHPHVRSLDIWETTYYHILEGENPVVEWTKGTALRPVLSQLNEVEAREFLERYGNLMKAAYPPGPDGKTIFPFRRLFIVAVK